jgi:hypothetical protein
MDMVSGCRQRAICASLSWQKINLVSGSAQAEGRKITVAGMTLSVSFSPVDAALNNSIDDAYRSKYAGRQYLNSMINERARTATIKVEARN